MQEGCCNVLELGKSYMFLSCTICYWSVSKIVLCMSSRTKAPATDSCTVTCTLNVYPTSSRVSWDFLLTLYFGVLKGINIRLRVYHSDLNGKWEFSMKIHTYSSCYMNLI